MPNFNRRRFLQFIGAAGMTPLLPSLPGRAVVATAGASTSKALWAGIYAKSGSVPKFLAVARNMGLSNTAIQGVSARSVGVRLAAAAVANPISGIVSSGNATPSSPKSLQTEPLKTARKFIGDIDRTLSIGTDEPAPLDKQASETSEPVSTPKKAEDGTL